MTEEFNLSEKIGEGYDPYVKVILVEDVKIFIKKLKEEINKMKLLGFCKEVNEKIDKIFGEELSK